MLDMKKKYEEFKLTIKILRADVVTASPFENETKDFDSWFTE